MTSSRVIPIPSSLIVMVWAVSSTPIRMEGWGSWDNNSGFLMDSNLSLSIASEALEISSLKKISRFEYSECTMRCSICLTSVWKPKVSFLNFPDDFYLGISKYFSRYLANIGIRLTKTGNHKMCNSWDMFLIVLTNRMREWTRKLKIKHPQSRRGY